MSIYFFFFFFLILFRHVARKLQTTNPGDFNRTANDLHARGEADGNRGEPVSSNSFGKAPSSVKIKGTVERFTTGRHEGEEATCVQSYHLARDKNLLATFPSSDYILRL